MMTITKEQGAAMEAAVDRYNNDPARLRQIIMTQQKEIERLSILLSQPSRAITMEPNGNLQSVLQVRGRAVTSNLSEIARHFNVCPSTANRWADANKLEKHTDASGQTFYYLDQSRPARKSRQKSQ